MIKDKILKTKLFNFLGLAKKVILKNNYMVIKVYSLKGVKNIEKFIEEKLEGHLGEIQELLIHYEILKINNEKQIVIYILKDNKDLGDILRKNLKVNLKSIQIERSENIKKKLKIKSGLVILKDKNNFHVMSFANGILVSYDETTDFNDINVEYEKEFLEKILKKSIEKIYISKEVLEENTIKLEDLKLIPLGV